MEDQGKRVEALDAFDQAVAILKYLLEKDKTNTDWQRVLAWLEGEIGEVLENRAKLPESLEAYRNYLAIADRLTNRDPRQDQLKTIHSLRTTTTLAAQRELTKRGFDPGPTDGVPGLRTSEAISQFQRQAGLPVSGTLDNQTLKQLGLLPEPTPSPPSQTPEVPSQKINKSTPGKTSIVAHPYSP